MLYKTVAWSSIQCTHDLQNNCGVFPRKMLKYQILSNDLEITIILQTTAALRPFNHVLAVVQTRPPSHIRRWSTVYLEPPSITFHVVMVADDCRPESVMAGARRAPLGREKLPIFGWASQGECRKCVSVGLIHFRVRRFLAHAVRLMELSERALLLLGSHLPGRRGGWDEVQLAAASLPQLPSSNNKTVWYPLEAPKPPQFNTPHCLSHTAAFVEHSDGHVIGFVWKK